MYYPNLTKTEGNTEYMGLVLLKDYEQVAYMYVVNESSSEKELGECKVNRVSIRASDEDKDRCVVEGIPLKELTVEKLTDVKGEPSSQLEQEGEDGMELHTSWVKGKYSLKVESLQEDGTILEVVAEYDAN